MALTQAPEELLDKSLTSELTITTADGKTENYKQHMSNLMGMRNSIFWTNFKN